MHFIRQAAEAIAAVHAAGFVHRDVSPRNFLLADRDKKELKLIDFGVSLPCQPQFQQPGVRTGNPNYMAPEIVRRKPTDQRVDVFAFGVSAYEICTGELPWLRGTTGMAAMSHDRPPTDILKYRPKLHPELAKAIHSCIEADVASTAPRWRSSCRRSTTSTRMRFSTDDSCRVGGARKSLHDGALRKPSPARL